MNVKNLMWLSITASTLIVTGCASTSHITPKYVSPNTYNSYDCDNLGQEYKRITTYIEKAGKQSFSLASTGINIGMYGNRQGIFPTVSFGVGQNRDTQRDSRLSQLQGERDAIIQSARLKSCQFANGLKIFDEE